MKRTPLKRGKGIRKRNPERQKSEWARAYGSKERVRFVKALPCRVPGCDGAPSENAHITTGGTGRKADADQVIPLCHTHHVELDEGIGSEAFEEKYGISLRECADWTDWKWRSASTPESGFD